MVADGVEGLLADVVLDLAGVRLGGGGVHAQRHEKAGEGVVPVQHTLGDGQTGGRPPELGAAGVLGISPATRYLEKCSKCSAIMPVAAV